MRTLFISLACAAALLAAQPVMAAPVSRIAAVVNGDMITVRELDKVVSQELAAQKIDPAKNPSMAETIRRGVLDNMITEKLIRQQAAKEEIEVTGEELDAAMERVIRESQLTREVFLQQMKKEGITEELFRDQLGFQMLSQRLMNRNVVNKVVVTEDEINEYYRRNIAGFASGRARVGLLIYSADVNAEKWADDISKGRVSFSEAARKVSVGPNAEGGGDLGFMELSDMAPGMLDQVSRMKKGDVSPLLTLGTSRGQVALLDFEEAEIDDASQAVPDEDTARRIEQILRNPRVQERFQQYTTQLREKALIDIRN